MLRSVTADDLVAREGADIGSLLAEAVGSSRRNDGSTHFAENGTQTTAGLIIIKSIQLVIFYVSNSMDSIINILVSFLPIEEKLPQPVTVTGSFT